MIFFHIQGAQIRPYCEALWRKLVAWILKPRYERKSPHEQHTTLSELLYLRSLWRAF